MRITAERRSSSRFDAVVVSIARLENRSAARESFLKLSVYERMYDIMLSCNLPGDVSAKSLDDRSEISLCTITLLILSHVVEFLLSDRLR